MAAGRELLLFGSVRGGHPHMRDTSCGVCVLGVRVGCLPLVGRHYGAGGGRHWVAGGGRHWVAGGGHHWVAGGGRESPPPSRYTGMRRRGCRFRSESFDAVLCLVPHTQAAHLGFSKQVLSRAQNGNRFFTVAVAVED